jgi:hypothetical protein
LNNPTLDPTNNNGGGISIGFNGTGQLDITGTGVVNTYFLALGRTDGAAGTAAGTVNISGGTANIYNTLYFGAGYGGIGTASTTGTVSSQLNVSGGILKIGQGGIINASTGSGYGYSVILNGGTLATTGTTGWSSSVNMTLQKGANGNVTFDGGSHSITLSGILSGTGGLNVGGGTLLLSGANTYTGNTLITAQLQLTNGAQLTFKIGANGNSNYLGGSGGLDADGGFLFDLTGASTNGGDQWIIVQSTLQTQYGANFWIGDTIGGQWSDDSGIWTSASGTYQFDQSQGILSVIPEPSSVVLLLGGGTLLLALAGPRRRA